MLHVVRYNRQNLDALIEQINAAGYGLTLGIHTRIDETIAQVTEQAKVGNQYVNRNMVGAVVGVQPFGGEGLSGTGPKAGGPLYVYRLLSSRPDDAVSRTLARQDYEQNVDATLRQPLLAAHQALLTWAQQEKTPRWRSAAKSLVIGRKEAPSAYCQVRQESAIHMHSSRVNVCYVCSTMSKTP